ncbi:LacI family DNA-binding transcriptional regulator [Propionibacteriaceae bacterium Y1685]|uniref:LacI family DNA-binding transcriptional regulator n=1 Tax=Microlunatus sp. Y1700 TaxID=3418487 RepID=UPI003B7F8A9F
MARVTIKTVAEHVGVSPSTVSNAYNRPTQLSADLRERILAAAAQLGYGGPDAAGRTLRSGRAGAVGVLLTESLSYAFSDPYAVRFLAGLSQVVEHTDNSILVLPPSAEAVQRANLDAITTLCIRDEHGAAKAAATRGIRTVGTAMTDKAEDSWVAIDDREAGRLVGRHLTRLGHRRVTVLLDNGQEPGTLSEDVVPTGIQDPDSQLRWQGLREAMPEAEFTTASGGYNSYESGRAVAPLVLDRQDRPTAVVAISDALALGFLHALRTRGLTAGRDLSVVGFDDISGSEAAGLTTVRQPIEEKGRLVGQLLLDPDLPNRQVLLPIELIVRSSTGPA